MLIPASRSLRRRCCPGHPTIRMGFPDPLPARSPALGNAVGFEDTSLGAVIDVPVGADLLDAVPITECLIGLSNATMKDRIARAAVGVDLRSPRFIDRVGVVARTSVIARHLHAHRWIGSPAGLERIADPFPQRLLLDEWQNVNQHRVRSLAIASHTAGVGAATPGGEIPLSRIIHVND